MRGQPGWVLLTNDDGVDAPGLVPFAAALADVAPTRIVVPDRERSWVGKAITRLEPVRVSMLQRHGFQVHAVSGYPADCVQLGVHTVFDAPPLLVVSGINIGYNHGSAFLQSSGTVGAALEASIAGVAAIAFSTGSTQPWGPWKAWVESPASRSTWERLAGIAANMTAALLTHPDPELLLSINLPDDADMATERRLTSIAAIGYDRLFREDSPGVFVHDFGGGVRYRDTLAGTDIEAALDGAISITPLRSAHAVAPAPGLAGLLGAGEKP